MSTTSCNPDRLLAVLDGDPSHPDHAAVSAHVTECRRCQETLEEFAADASWWDRGRDWLVAADVTEVAMSTTSIEAVHGDQSGTPIASVDFLEPPTQPELLGQLGKYQIESVIGQGGMGIVLKGFDCELNRAVAIKVLAPHLASSGSARQRFAREARAAAAVVHDHVVAIHGIETGNDLPYLVMPFVGGESLQRHVERNGPLDPTDITRIAMQIAAGLGAAHEQGLVHRDIKPANVLLENGFGRVLITDFGLARAADDASITRSGLVAGTPHYMSPEQANGGRVDARSDLFSLGSVVYFMATGRAPFRADGAMAVLHAICNKPAPAIRDVNPEIPVALEVVTQRLLQKRPEERFSSAAKVRSLLADYLAHRQDPARNPIPSLLKDTPTKTKIARAASLTVLALWGLWVGTGFLPNPEPPPESQPGTASSRPRGVIEPSHFDTELNELHAEIIGTEQRWLRARSHLPSGDNWDQQYKRLSDAMGRAEVEWSGISPN